MGHPANLTWYDPAMASDDELIPDEDDGEDFAEGDTPLDEIDWEQVAELERRQLEVLALPDDQRPMAMLGLLHEMHGDDLKVL